MNRPGDPAESRWKSPGRLVRWQEWFVHGMLASFAVLTILTTLGILVVLGSETVRFFRTGEVTPLEFLTGTAMRPEADPPRYGVLPLVWGTLVITVGSSLIALPIGLAAAIYLSEYANFRTRSILKPILELLAGVPTIVYGYLALLLVTPLLRYSLGLVGIKVDTYNAASAAIVVGIMIIPMVSSLSEDVLRAVPQGLREAAYGLGATKFEVSTQVVVPAGLSGIMASFILAFSRAIGETMAVVLAAGQMPQISPNVFASVQTMTAYIVSVTSGDAPYGSPEHLSLFAVGTVLFLMTLSLNLISGAILRRYREEYS
ncbi:phosphate ABC transporter permease subunit PstC [bacterium]|nr:phosphate ABC transporter permease subunit PstC [bacterium]